MKKIVSAALVASLVAGAAFADIAVKLNSRVRPYIYKLDMYEKSTDKGEKDTTFLGLDDYGAATESLKFNASSDYAGVALTLDVTTGTKKEGSIAVNDFYGWVNWGAFKVTTGTFDSRYTNRGNYTATEEGILDKEFDKGLGLSGKLLNGLTTTGNGKQLKGGNEKADGTESFLKDFGNVSQVGGGNGLSFLADYTFGDVGGGKLLIKGGLVENNYGGTTYDTYPATNAKDKDTFSQIAGYVAEAAWRLDKTVAVDVIFKNPVHNAYGVGLYVTPLLIPNASNVVLGFTYGTQKDVTKTAFAIDARGTYKITDAAVVALGAKYESIEADVDNAKADTGFQVALEGSYKVNDTLTLALDFGYFNYDLDDNDKTDEASQKIVAGLRGKIFAGKNAAITAAAKYTAYLNPYDKADVKREAGLKKGTFEIPVVFRVAF